MRVILFTDEKHRATLEALVKNAGISAVDENPDAIISYGGDGTLMRAEYAYPGIPKLLLKGSAVCKLCSPLPNEEVLKKFGAGGYRVDEIEKLEVRAKEKILRGINDIIVHNDNPRHAIRYHLFVNDKQIGGEIIGDGVIVATPLGSTGYYRSITGSFFELGIGVAFNNSTEQADHMVLREDAIVRVGITRGPAFVYADNQKEAIPLANGDEVTVQRSSAVARIIRVA